ncbi:MAG: glycosyltransferase family 4 protein [Thermomicrobiales bacterium]
MSPLFDNEYLKQKYDGATTSLFRSLVSFYRRAETLVGGRTFDLVWIEKEAIPYMPARIESFLLGTRTPYVVDYDDAIFHNYDRNANPLIRRILGRKIDTVMRHSRMVIAGNPYIAGRATLAGASTVEILPTVIDLDRYPTPDFSEPHDILVGWIGTPVTSKFLDILRPVFHSDALDPAVKLVAIGSGPLDWSQERFVSRPWTTETEVDELRRVSIGVMPLVDSDFERGKSGLKLLQYMAVGIPVVASPVGVNTSIVEHGVNGFLVSTEKEWLDAINLLAADAELRERMGRAGRQKVEDQYSLQSAAPRLSELLKSAAFSRP